MLAIVEELGSIMVSIRGTSGQDLSLILTRGCRDAIQSGLQQV